jgi:hypothetical protein
MGRYGPGTPFFKPYTMVIPASLQKMLRKHRPPQWADPAHKSKSIMAAAARHVQLAPAITLSQRTITSLRAPRCCALMMLSVMTVTPGTSVMMNERQHPV